MKLTAEQRAAGRETFREVSRRDFIKGGIVAGAVSGGSLGAFYFGYEATLENPVRVAVLGTGDEGSVLIGAINPDYVEVQAIADVRPYNVHRAFHGDHYSEGALKYRPGLMTKYGWKTETEARKHVKVYGDYGELLDAVKDGYLDVEAVIIGLPLHLHAKAAIEAMQAGLHVLTEKLMGHSVHECKDMARTAALTRRHLATGHQRHYNILYADAMDTIKRGVLGDLHYIRAQWHRGNMPGSDSWQQPMPREVKPDDKQATKLLKDLDKRRKELEEARGREIHVLARRVAQLEAQIADVVLRETAAEYGYEAQEYKDATGKRVYYRPEAEELIRWRLWDRTGGGLMAELGSHQLDAASIFISAMHGGEKQHPLNVAAISNRPVFEQDRECDDHVYCMFEFPAPDYDPDDDYRRRKTITVAYASINGNGFGGYGETVFGTKGTLVLERETDAMLFATGATALSGKIKVAEGPKLALEEEGDPVSAAIGVQGLAPAGRGYTEQLEHWAWCIRKDPKNTKPEIQPHCHPKVALGDAVIALVTNLAAEKGQRITFDPRWFDPDRDETPEKVKPDVSRYP